MKGEASPVVRVLVAASLVTGIVACTHGAQPDAHASGPSPRARSEEPVDARAPAPPPAASSMTTTPPSAPPAAPVDAGAARVSAPAPSFVAWTDPAAIKALAADCHAAKPDWDYDKHDGHEDPLACTLLYEQSCNYDPCVNRLQTCREGCSKTCRSCDEGCGKTCDDCTAKCKTDACRLACATKTGACKQACVTAIDRCATGTCAAAMKPCYVSEKAAWRAHGCSCKKIAPCTDGCIGNGGDIVPCLAGCRAKFPGCDTGYCIQGTDPTADP